MEQDEPKFPRLPPEIIEMIFKQLPWNAVTILWKTSKELQNLLTEVTQEIICTEQGEMISNDVDILVMLDNMYIIHPIIQTDEIGIITKLLDNIGSLSISTELEINELGFPDIVDKIINRIETGNSASVVQVQSFIIEQIGSGLSIINLPDDVREILTMFDQFKPKLQINQLSAVENIILNVPRIYIQQGDSILETFDSQVANETLGMENVECIYASQHLQGSVRVFEFPNIRKVFVNFRLGDRFLVSRSVEQMTIHLTNETEDEINIIADNLELEMETGSLTYEPILVVRDSIEPPDTRIPVITDTEFDRLTSFDMEFERQSIEHLKRVCS